MAQTVTERFADRLLEQSDAYGASVVETTDALADAMADYPQDERLPPSARTRLDELESACDRRLQSLRQLVGKSMPPNFTEAYLRTGDLLEIYRSLDVIANRSEQFIVELTVTTPPLETDVRACLRDMSRRIAVATERLVGVMDAYVESLLTDGERVYVEPHVEAIRAYESDCDAIRDAVIASVFADGIDVQALYVKELVVALDGVMDAVEDVADQLLYMNSADF